MRHDFKFMGYTDVFPCVQMSDYWRELDYFILDYDNYCIKRIFSRLMDGGFDNIHKQIGKM